MLRCMCMRRTNLVLDGDLLKEAARVSGERNYSRTVERVARNGDADQGSSDLGARGLRPLAGAPLRDARRQASVPEPAAWFSLTGSSRSRPAEILIESMSNRWSSSTRL